MSVSGRWEMTESEWVRNRGATSRRGRVARGHGRALNETGRDKAEGSSRWRDGACRLWTEEQIRVLS